MSKDTLLVNKLFFDFDGEVNIFGQGTASIFLRLQSCNLTCPFCDAKQAIRNTNGEVFKIPELLLEIYELNQQFSFPNKLTITGGEPLLQAKSLTSLLYQLPRGFDVTMETNGTINIEYLSTSPDYLFLKEIDSIIYDYKLPSQQPSKSHYKDNWFYFRKSDFLKFVIEDKYDFGIAISVAQEFCHKTSNGRLAFSHNRDTLPLSHLVAWVRGAARTGMLPMNRVVINTQIHKDWKNYEEVSGE